MRAILDRVNGEECTTPTSFRSNAAPLRKIAGGRVAADNYMFEAAGVAFFNRFERKVEAASKKRGKHDHASSDDEHSDDGEEFDTKGTKDKTGGILKLSPLLKDVELYPLMGVQEGASQDDIKKAYRALALSCHPDKMGDVDEAEAKRVQEHFVKIQEAYEILSDPPKRQLYDSSLPFDESIPRFKPGEGDDFFQVFSEAFRRNARFSQRRPVPELGGAATPLSDVKKFYDFWFGFSSWRDPMVMAQADGQDLHDLEDAECREEKRWMIRENQRVGRKYKQTEKDRITKLVNLAEASDPRILAEKEAKKAARAAEAARRQDERMAAERAKEAAQQKKREEEEALQAVEAEKRKKEKAIKEAAKAEVKKFRQRLRTLHSLVKEYVHNEQLNEVCLQLDCAALQKLGDTVEKALKRGDKGKEDAVASFHAAIKSLGLTPMIPKEEDVVSTSSGGPSEEATPAVVEDPAVVAERKRIEDARRKEAEARKKVEDAKRAAEREKMAALAAEERKKREEQRRKEEQAAETKRKQMEKKEREKAKKEEEKKRKAEEQEVQRREQQREAARQKASEQAAKADEEAQALVQAREIERVVKLFEDDRQERLDALDPLTDEDLVQHLDGAFQTDKTLCGALNLLKKANIEDDQRRDCLMVLLSTIGPIWQLALDPPADVKPQNSIRNKTKKARQRLRDVAHKRFAALADNFGSEHVKTVTPYQKGMVAGQFEWPVWTLEVREEELRVRTALDKSAQPISEDVPPAAEQQTAEAPSGKKGKKAKDQKKAGGDEDLDSLFAEFGVVVDEKKGKKKKR